MSNINNDTNNSNKVYQTSINISASFPKERNNKRENSFSNNRNKNIFNKNILIMNNLKNKRESVLSTINTLVYNLPFMSNEKTKSNKIYSKIALELKKIFYISPNDEIEDNKDNNDNNQQKKNISKNLSQLSNILDYKTIIRRPPNERSMLDLYLIIKYLSNTKLGTFFKEEFDDNIEIYDKLITFCAVEIQYRKFRKGETIFKIGDLPDNFYIILQGKIEVVKPKKKKMIMTGKEYFYYLMDLQKTGDKYVFNLCIENNINNYIIDRKEAKLIPYIFILINLEKINLGNQIDFGEVLYTVDIPSIKLGLNNDQICDENYIKDNINVIKKNIPYDISADLIEKYNFIMDSHKKKEIIIYNYIKFLSLETNDYFGDSALDNNTTRNETIIAKEDTDVGYIETNLYCNNIGVEKYKLINKKRYFLFHNFFFKKLNPKKFEQKFFGCFISNNYKKGDIIYKENEMPLFVYFIEEGKVELSSSKNIIEIEKTIEALNRKRKNLDKLIKIERQHTDNPNENKKLYEGEFLYDKIKNNCKDLLMHLKKKEPNKLFILGKNEDLGLISFYFNYPYITDCVVISNKAKIFKININDLNEILNYEKNCLIDSNKRIKYKLQLFQERFFNINNTKFLIADKIETNKTNKMNELLEQENMIKQKELLHKHDILSIFKNEKNEIKIDMNKFKDFCKNLINKNADIFK